MAKTNGGAVIGYCLRCQGAGYMRHFSHVSGGACFACKGEGLIAYGTRNGFESLSRDDKVAFLDSGLAWLRHGGEDHFVSRCPGWRKRVARWMGECLKSCDRELFDACETAWRAVPGVRAERISPWFASHRPAESASL